MTIPLGMASRQECCTSAAATNQLIASPPPSGKLWLGIDNKETGKRVFGGTREKTKN